MILLVSQFLVGKTDAEAFYKFWWLQSPGGTEFTVDSLKHMTKFRVHQYSMKLGLEMFHYSYLRADKTVDKTTVYVAHFAHNAISKPTLSSLRRFVRTVKADILVMCQIEAVEVNKYHVNSQALRFHDCAYYDFFAHFDPDNVLLQQDKPCNNWLRVKQFPENELNSDKCFFLKSIVGKGVLYEECVATLLNTFGHQDTFLMFSNGCMRINHYIEVVDFINNFCGKDCKMSIYDCHSAEFLLWEGCGRNNPRIFDLVLIWPLSDRNKIFSLQYCLDRFEKLLSDDEKHSMSKTLVLGYLYGTEGSEWYDAYCDFITNDVELHPMVDKLMLCDIRGGMLDLRNTNEENNATRAIYMDEEENCFVSG